uniref:Uncharacterized protein n=1 Tax=Chromera velia CCMP2878 TaxID=1169474 RepID=A0A0G4GRJ5_9ALVE|mmetsp:Transcript_6322/g.12525  ORF Transcript_6322/g.12525 Transcript_6322/m.12525 type:complete len:354 (+) Transcript_6322:363-1424(+)|eukprot:Cvel_23081.t1-p1 / transcript=Cvel_23081.t1 / gene=Cvel_23081 / organism=Chromera_velia_CCMP2878 / gene_product=Serine/threonine-protein phosphatase 6 regulatory, putative / transcript_product=Serine/threonine-protein phosphatase 6 regulatory, putative / location=Cvel_scaffold2338:2250-3308(+) / protein_length=353 / sequence_SO=supercontig / SO=protein_coding / is_pseudo=false
MERQAQTFWPPLLQPSPWVPFPFNANPMRPPMAFAPSPFPPMTAFPLPTPVMYPMFPLYPMAPVFPVPPRFLRGPTPPPQRRKVTGLSSLLRCNVGKVIRSFGGASAEQLRSALLTFLDRGDVDDLWLLLRVGADLDGLVEGDTALMVAVERGSVFAVRILLEAGARVGVQMPHRSAFGHMVVRARTVLSVVCTLPSLVQLEILRLLLCSLRQETEELRSRILSESQALQIAAIFASPPVLDLLLSLKHGANVHWRGALGKTALHCAATFGKKENVVLLLARGAGVEVCDGLQYTPLLTAVVAASSVSYTADTDHIGVMEVLVRHGADVNRRAFGGIPMLHEAATPAGVRTRG